MSSDAMLGAALQLAAMVAVAGAYVATSRRHAVLRHPVAIFLAVMIVGVTVSLLGQLYRGGWDTLPAMARRSVVGSAGWGLVITLVAWPVLRFMTRRRGRRPSGYP